MASSRAPPTPIMTPSQSGNSNGAGFVLAEGAEGEGMPPSVPSHPSGSVRAHDMIVEEPRATL